MATRKTTRKATAVATAPQPTLTLTQYREDVVARWAIHQYETKALAADVRAAGVATRQLLDGVVDYLTPHVRTVVARINN